MNTTPSGSVDSGPAITRAGAPSEIGGGPESTAFVALNSVARLQLINMAEGLAVSRAFLLPGDSAAAELLKELERALETGRVRLVLHQLRYGAGEDFTGLDFRFGDDLG